MHARRPKLRPFREVVFDQRFKLANLIWRKLLLGLLQLSDEKPGKVLRTSVAGELRPVAVAVVDNGAESLALLVIELLMRTGEQRRDFIAKSVQLIRGRATPLKARARRAPVGTLLQRFEAGLSGTTRVSLRHRDPAPHAGKRLA